MTNETTVNNEGAATKQAREAYIGPTFVEIYANSCEAGMSQWDIQLIFGRNDDSQGLHRDQKVAKIYLSPLHAKAVANILAMVVGKYEEQFGKLRLPGQPEEKLEEPAAKP